MSFEGFKHYEHCELSLIFRFEYIIIIMLIFIISYVLSIMSVNIVEW